MYTSYLLILNFLVIYVFSCVTRYVNNNYSIRSELCLWNCWYNITLLFMHKEGTWWWFLLRRLDYSQYYLQHCLHPYSYAHSWTGCTRLHTWSSSCQWHQQSSKHNTALYNNIRSELILLMVKGAISLHM